MHISRSFPLTHYESNFFRFLLRVVDVQPPSSRSVIRVAGGWVRDKLLNRTTEDIDIVVDNMTGKQFADLINEYETSQGETTHPIGVVKANPEQSKHLETATVQFQFSRLKGFKDSKDVNGSTGSTGSKSSNEQKENDKRWIDFVHLRTESYSQNSRIPQINFGTPQEDASRRDFTVNALFYNIAEDTIEDFTKTGLNDLEKGILRTPLNVKETLLDDPLRVLRGVRFASRLKFQMSEELEAAMSLSEVQKALDEKISRERIGKEITGMLIGNSADPYEAFRMLHCCGLCPAVFSVSSVLKDTIKPLPTVSFSSKVNVEEWNKKIWPISALMLKMHREVTTSVSLVSENQDGNECKKVKIDGEGERKGEKTSSLQLEGPVTIVEHLACIFYPLSDAYILDKKKKKTPVAGYIIRESLKLPSRTTNHVLLALSLCDEYKALVQEIHMLYDGKRSESKLKVDTQADAQVQEQEQDHRATETGTETEKKRKRRNETMPVSLSDAQNSILRLRTQAGLLMRELKELWVVTHRVCVVSEMVSIEEKREKKESKRDLKEKEQRTRILQKYADVELFYESNGLIECWKMGPLLNGKEVMQTLNVKGGPELKTILHDMICWQLQNENATKEDALVWLKQRKRT